MIRSPRRFPVIGGSAFSLSLSLAAAAGSLFAGPSRFTYVVNKDGQPQPGGQARIPAAFRETLAKVETELGTDEHLTDGALVYRIRAADGRALEAQTELHYIGGRRGGYRPGRAVEEEPAYILIPQGQAVELRVIAANCETFIRRTIIRQSQITVWDDIVLTLIDPASAAKLTGSVWLEGEEEEGLDGIVIEVNEEAVAFTDADGNFTATGVRSGEVRVSAHKPGFVGLHTTIKVDSKKPVVCELNGYKERLALVRWVYQPKPERSFLGNVTSGKATLSRKLDRISFKEAFKQVDRHSDFLFVQKEDKLTIRNFDQSGPKGPGFTEIKGSHFDRVLEAPESEFRSDESELRPGAIFVFRCYDGEHFAKMEVLKVGTAEEVGEGK